MRFLYNINKDRTFFFKDRMSMYRHVFDELGISVSINRIEEYIMISIQSDVIIYAERSLIYVIRDIMQPYKIKTILSSLGYELDNFFLFGDD